uniref:Uncharacterized protein n=1 Tax=Peronospora matthiolae TaxID=2874970 RepID=A0AAV1TL71_9STRA
MIFVEGLDGVGRKPMRSIVPNKLDLRAELSLNLDNVVLDTVFVEKTAAVKNVEKTAAVKKTPRQAASSVEASGRRFT